LLAGELPGWCDFCDDRFLIQRCTAHQARFCPLGHPCPQAGHWRGGRSGNARTPLLPLVP
jgi:hypothetical protein